MSPAGTGTSTEPEAKAAAKPIKPAPKPAPRKPVAKSAKAAARKPATGKKPALPPLPRGARRRALEVVERLRPVYPAVCELEHRDPFELTIATILSAQTTDQRVNQVTPALFERYPDAFALAAADPSEVEAIIKPTGFFRAKARTIIACARALVVRFGGKVPPRMEDLLTLPGIGRKTANVILGVGFGIPGFPVDTHVIRLANRLKLVSTRDPVKIEAQITSVVPESEWTELSLRLILHGRRICLARRPRCERCVLSDICPSSLV